MIRLLTQRGHAMPLMLFFCMLLFIAAQQTSSKETQQIFYHVTNSVEQQQSLAAASSALLAFATRQGLNSHTQAGHMPCPARFSNGPSQTTCLNRNWGWLPGQAVARINYLNPGLALPYNAQQSGPEKSWQYAVSTQLIQPNTLGWSQWVDFSLPALTVLADGTTHPNVAAVIAHRIEALGPHTMQVEAPYVLISVRDLQANLGRRHAQEIAHTVHLHQRLLPPAIHWAQNHEYLVNLAPSLWQPIDSGCSCRCTRTRCTCQCANQGGQWVSHAHCASGQSHCTTNPGPPQTSRCTSSTGQACVFQGTAQLQSQWPVARYLPAPGHNRACQPVAIQACPLSALPGQSCDCTFGWPISTLNRLPDTRIGLGAENQVNVQLVGVPAP
ncbi:MAG TPA: hypothetical protein VFV43_01060 [Limnobacter sp.]|nr:hypothetical protein [Limnobacter sp.]